MGSATQSCGSGFGSTRKPSSSSAPRISFPLAGPCHWGVWCVPSPGGCGRKFHEAENRGFGLHKPSPRPRRRHLPFWDPYPGPYSLLPPHNLGQVFSVIPDSFSCSVVDSSLLFPYLESLSDLLFWSQAKVVAVRL